ncbi:5-hydroxytryptamine receptor 4-like [Patiria miniata]|uniref:G-protein coupled receptors family 1 profile domain-containing protein n=1 Tax=Patiria miniata TaxID=46514 RepID=A0A913YZQ7_PATMI|nr:5-hydroxytryptamine receptor 4-like [Patiria miniata]
MTSDCNVTLDQQPAPSDDFTNQVYFSYAQRQVIAAVLALVSTVGLFGNSLVIIAVVLSKRLHRTTNLFVLNLGLTDLLTCAFLPVQSVAVLSECVSPLLGTVCAFVGFLSVTCLSCSINNLLCIALNRFFLIIKDRSTYRRIYRLRNAVLMMLATWLIPIATVAIPALTGYITLGFDPKDSSCSWVASKSSPNYSYVIFGTCIPLQFTLIIWSYTRVFSFIRRHTKSVAHLEKAAKPRPTTLHVSEVSSRDETKEEPLPRRCQPFKLQYEVTKNLFLVLVLFMICVTPFGVSLALAALDISGTGRALPFTATLLTINSCLNPIIYALKHPHFQIVFRCILRGQFSKIPDRIKFP